MLPFYVAGNVENEITYIQEGIIVWVKWAEADRWGFGGHWKCVGEKGKKQCEWGQGESCGLGRRAKSLGKCCIAKPRGRPTVNGNERTGWRLNSGGHSAGGAMDTTSERVAGECKWRCAVNVQREGKGDWWRLISPSLFSPNPNQQTSEDGEAKGQMGGNGWTRLIPLNGEFELGWNINCKCWYICNS
jgi:hypothetical protein